MNSRSRRGPTLGLLLFSLLLLGALLSAILLGFLFGAAPT